MPKRFVTTKVEIEGREETKVVEVPSRNPTPWDEAANLHVVGKRVPRMDAIEKVTGRAQYTADIQRPGMLHAAILRRDQRVCRHLEMASPHPLARGHGRSVRGGRCRRPLRVGVRGRSHRVCCLPSGGRARERPSRARVRRCDGRDRRWCPLERRARGLAGESRRGCSPQVRNSEAMNILAATAWTAASCGWISRMTVTPTP